MTEDVKDEMAWVYGQGADPWKYDLENRHWLTVALAAQYWRGGILAELPCAEGILSKRLIDSLRPQPLQFWSVDLMEVAVQRARANLHSGANPLPRPSIQIEVCDLRETFPELYAEMVIVHDVLPMLTQEVATRVIKDAASRVLPGGTLMLSSWTSPGYYEDPHFGDEEIKGFTLEQTIAWTGHAFDLKNQRYKAAAQYRLYKRVTKGAYGEESP